MRYRRRHTQHHPEIEKYDPNLTVLQRDGRIDGAKQGHDADNIQDASDAEPNASQRLGRPDPPPTHKKATAIGVQGDVTRPAGTPTDVAVVIKPPSCEWPPLAVSRRLTAYDSVGYWWACRRRRTETAPRQPRQRGLDEHQDRGTARQWRGSMNESRELTRDSAKS